MDLKMDLAVIQLILLVVQIFVAICFRYERWVMKAEIGIMITILIISVVVRII